MPKGRMLAKKISYDEQVAKLSIKATLLYTWCLPHLDVQGRYYADANIIKGSVVPYIGEYTIGDIDNYLTEMVNVGLVVLYGNGRKYMYFKGFHKNQVIVASREAPSAIPSPDGTPDKVVIRSRVEHEEVKLSKVKQSKVKEILCHWNQHLSPKVKEITNERKKHLNARLEEKSFVDGWEDIVLRIKNSDFLSGRGPRNGHQNWKPTFDWVIKNQDNYTKILEGNYDNKPMTLVDKYGRK